MLAVLLHLLPVFVVLQIKMMGTRENAAAQDFSGIPLEEEEESHLKDAAVISMGTEISVEDMMNIEALCDQVPTFNPAAR